MEPPPKDLRETMLRAVRELALGGKFQYFLRRALSMNRAGEFVGSIAVNSRIGESEWQVFDLLNGVRLQNVATRDQKFDDARIGKLQRLPH